jgi:REP-associated tyrosine transposase
VRLVAPCVHNHEQPYHLAVETPEGKLVEGRRWLQGTFGIRFNALRGERGHVFQSRYKSLLIEEGRPILGLVNYRLVNYIHLNPVRAGLVIVAKLRAYAWSSYPKFFKSRPPQPLRRERFLFALEFPDSAAGNETI